MPPTTPSFRGDPYRLLGVSPNASAATIKRRWRQLAVEHHPDTAVADPGEATRLTRRMARINAAYDLLRDETRRQTYDASPAGQEARAAWEREWAATGDRGIGATDRPIQLSGPPPPPPTRPVTARFDMSALYHHHNTRRSEGEPQLRGQPPIGRRPGEGRRDEDLRASQPTGPVNRAQSNIRGSLPTLAEAWATPLDFGRFHGRTLGEIALREPAYLDWIARTITRDRDLVIRARVILNELRRGDQPGEAGDRAGATANTADRFGDASSV